MAVVARDWRTWPILCTGNIVKSILLNETSDLTDGNIKANRAALARELPMTQRAVVGSPG
jgi:hypothetical protein